MRWSDKINVQAPDTLKVEHKFGQTFLRYTIAGGTVADIMILAEDTAEIAISKKDGPGTSPSNKWGLFTKVREGAGNFRFSAGLTNTFFSIQAVYSTFMRAESAAIQDTS